MHSRVKIPNNYSSDTRWYHKNVILTQLSAMHRSPVIGEAAKLLHFYLSFFLFESNGTDSRDRQSPFQIPETTVALNLLAKFFDTRCTQAPYRPFQFAVLRGRHSNTTRLVTPTAAYRTRTGDHQQPRCDHG